MLYSSYVTQLCIYSDEYSPLNTENRLDPVQFPRSISILPSSTQAIFTGIPVAWKPVAASGLNVFEIKLSVPSSLQKCAPSQYKEIPPSFLVSWAWVLKRSITLWVAVQCSYT